MLATSSNKRGASVWHPSVCLSHLFSNLNMAHGTYSTMTHQGAAHDAARMHFHLYIMRTDLLVVGLICKTALCCQVCSGDMTFHTICGIRLPHAEDFSGLYCLYLVCTV